MKSSYHLGETDGVIINHYCLETQAFVVQRHPQIIGKWCPSGRKINDVNLAFCVQPSY
jgi:hypothetical protein